MKKLLMLAAFIAMTVAVSAQKYLGGDVSLLPQYETKGAKYYEPSWSEIGDVLQYMKRQGMNSMRVRLFVDPSKASAEDRSYGAIQDLDYVKALGRRIKAKGFKFMLDLHYSDTWTDPAQHAVPSAWAGKSVAEMGELMYSYTCEVLDTLKANNAEPDFIQVGNEITFGLLWETGHVMPNSDNKWDNLSLYLKKGIQACREKSPKAKIVIHTEMSANSQGDFAAYVEPFMQRIATNNIDYDIIGLSYYAYLHGSLSVLDGLLTRLEQAYPSKKIQLVELAYPHAYYPEDAKFDYTSTYPATEAGQRQFTADLITMLNKHSKVDGLYWWWPEANEKEVDWNNPVTPSWNNNGLWDSGTGKVMEAIFELKNFLSEQPNAGFTVRASFVNQPGWNPVKCYAHNWPTVYSQWDNIIAASGKKMTFDENEYDVHEWTMTGVADCSDVPVNIYFHDGDWQDSDKTKHQMYETPFVNGATYRHYLNGEWWTTEVVSLNLKDSEGVSDHSADFYCYGMWGWQIGTVNYDRTVALNQKTTVCLPFGLTKEETASAGAFYQLKSYADGILTFVQSDTVAANTPYLFVPSVVNPFAAVYHKELPMTEQVSVAGGNAVFTGVTRLTDVESNAAEAVYGLNESTGKFEQIESGRVGAFRAYITLPASGAPASLTITLSAPSGITEMQTEEPKADGLIYDLTGRKLSNSKWSNGQIMKGLYIKDGKKYLFR